ncbi:ferric-dicitrate binding protein FerR (iron transport regulator) [Silvibacterium bohemicum]|uniref:Ferric-dicitrate binding protein FerR (Iron transport regulator) n=1 Tax=Silvibacterium bohemicum TaxID=1577686 RepID=A0A841JXR2_9BACT|nr:hypothetical protein [Silvibacterium bohemicum]MBB6145385.1 ferric-dicitrate binding protein FerR (iron transport regulator) [Silvibacterium bohemicum]
MAAPQRPNSDTATPSSSATATSPESSAASPEDAPPSRKTQRWLRTALFFAGSAAFGGLAVALWDRKLLTAMRSKDGERNPEPQASERTRDEDIY